MSFVGAVEAMLSSQVLFVLGRSRGRGWSQQGCPGRSYGEAAPSYELEPSEPSEVLLLQKAQVTPLLWLKQLPPQS